MNLTFSIAWYKPDKVPFGGMVKIRQEDYPETSNVVCTKFGERGVEIFSMEFDINNDEKNSRRVSNHTFSLLRMLKRGSIRNIKNLAAK